MPVSVRLDLVPPPQDDVVALRVYESTAGAAGPFVQIERTTAVGTFPTYISHHTTTLATSATSWFKAAWEYQGGVVGPVSQAAEGGQGPTLIGRVIERVMQRDGTLEEGVVAQEAEGAIEGFTGKNPYTASLSATYKELNGLVLLTLYRASLARVIQEAAASSLGADSWTIGLLSAKSQVASSSSAASSQAALDKLLELAQEELGLNASIILQLAQPSTTYNLNTPDQSRLIAWVTMP